MFRRRRISKLMAIETQLTQDLYIYCNYDEVTRRKTGEIKKKETYERSISYYLNEIYDDGKNDKFPKTEKQKWDELVKTLKGMPKDHIESVVDTIIMEQIK